MGRKNVDSGTGGTRVLERISYGEGVTTDKALNKRGRVHASYDGTGRTIFNSYDFKGNPVSTALRFITDGTIIAEWTATTTTPIESTTYTTAYTYDALNRLLTIVTPDSATTTNTYDIGGQLYSKGVTGLYSLNNSVIKSIEYDAKGRRTKVQQTSGAGSTVTTTTTYDYDPLSFRLRRIRTTRHSDSVVLQDLNYWYDAVGNVPL